MYDVRNILRKQPVAIASALRGVLHVLVLLGVASLDAPQLSGISLAVELVLGLFTWSRVTPVANKQEE